MHRGGSLRVGLRALSLSTALALVGGTAVADGAQPSVVAAWMRWASSHDAPSRDGSVEVDAGATDAGVESSDAGGALGGGSMDDAADAGSARLDLALEDGALFGDPRWTYTPPTFEQCFADPVIEHWVDGISPPQGTVCDVD